MLDLNRPNREEPLFHAETQQWLFSGMAEAGLPAICIETRHTKAFLKAQVNKSDRNDARELTRYRGSPAIKRGTSKFHAPVLCALDRNGAILERVLPDDSGRSIRAALNGRIEPQSLICTDGAGAFAAIAAEYCCEHRDIRLPPTNWIAAAAGAKPRTRGRLTLGRVNQRREELKSVINRRFHGVSTRWLPNYLALLQVLRSNRGDPLVFFRCALGARPTDGGTTATSPGAF